MKSRKNRREEKKLDINIPVYATITNILLNKVKTQ